MTSSTPSCDKDTDQGPCVRHLGHYGDCMPRKPSPDWAKNALGLLQFDD